MKKNYKLLTISGSLYLYSNIETKNFNLLPILLRFEVKIFDSYKIGGILNIIYKLNI